MNYRGRVVVVTGAGNGIGRCIAESYSSAGASVILAEKDELSGFESERLIKSRGGSAEFVRTDVRIPEDIENLFLYAGKKYGTVDILINNAAVSAWRSPYELSIDEWNDVINTNLRGAFLCSRHAALLMKERGGGSIVNISSTRAYMSEPGSEGYAASKGGLVALTHALAASFAPDRIQVNCICPGWIETGDYGTLRNEDHMQHFSGRVGKPEDIAGACLYLTSEGNTFINGASIVIDGGMTRKMIYEL